MWGTCEHTATVSWLVCVFVCVCVLTRISVQGCCMVHVCPDKDFCTGSAPLVTFATQHVSKCARQHCQEEAGVCKNTSVTSSHAAEVGRDLWTSFVQARPPRARRPRPCPGSCSVSLRMQSLQTLLATCSCALQCSNRAFCGLLGVHSFPATGHHSKEPGSVFFTASLQLLAQSRME